MPQRSDGLLLEDMLTACHHIRAFTEGKDQASFLADLLVQRAVEREFEILGEAAKRVSAENRARFSTIDWRSVADFRNRLIHGYDSVDPLRVWEILVEYLPVLETELRNIYHELPPS